MPALAPWLISFITGFLAALGRLIMMKAGEWLTAGLLFIGIKFIAYEGVVEPIRNTAANALTGLPGNILQWIGVLRVDQYLTIVFSAYAAALAKRVAFGKSNQPWRPGGTWRRARK